jgi:CRP-like cAMP-binding protein
VEDKALARRVALLKGMPLFNQLPAKEIETIVHDLRLKEFGRDEVIFRQGDESREVYFVLKGKVRIFTTSPSGNETSIAIFSTNDVIGELAAIDHEPRSATAKAVTAVSLLSMAQESFLHHLETMPRFALAFIRLLSGKLRWTAAYAESIAQYDAAGRLLHIILQANTQYGRAVTPGMEYIVDLSLNQTDLASMIGARREWVNRILGDWRRRGLLEFDAGVIHILDLPRAVAERDSRIEANRNSPDW